MLNQLLSLGGQSLFFILGVYVQKFLRSTIYIYQEKFISKKDEKDMKMTLRITICSIFTIILLLFNYSHQCSQQTFSNCFYLQFNMMQIIHAIIANNILFAVHIYEKFIKNQADYSRYTIKSLFFAPILEEILFRAAFYRIGKQIISIFVIAAFFSFSHLHIFLRKKIKGKDANWRQTINVIIFTYVFGLYSFYFLNAFDSVVPSMILHCYCNFLGPPSFNRQNFKFHLTCMLGFFLYCYIFI